MSGIDVVDSDTFTDPINAIADGEAENSANKKRATQGLSNRTRYLKNRLPRPFGVEDLAIAGPFSTSSPTFVDVTGMSLTVTAGANDVLDIRAILSVNHTANIARARIAIVDGASTVYSYEANTAAGGALQYDTMQMLKRYTVVNGGTITIKLQLANTGSTTTTATQGVITGTRFPAL